jgi:type I restriction enzyme S subunit
MSVDELVGWKLTAIGDLARVRRGASPRPIADPRWFSHEGPGWVRISDVTRSNGRLKETEQYLSPEGAARSVPVHPGQLIMSIAATIAEPVVLDIEACIHDGFVVIDDYDEHLLTQYLFHFIRFWAPFSTVHFLESVQLQSKRNRQLFIQEVVK